MVEITKIKDDLKAVLSQHGLLLSDIIVYAESDLNKNMCQANINLILTLHFMRCDFFPKKIISIRDGALKYFNRGQK